MDSEDVHLTEYAILDTLKQYMYIRHDDYVRITNRFILLHLPEGHLTFDPSYSCYRILFQTNYIPGNIVHLYSINNAT